MTDRLRVRVHLNLANPAQAESVVKIQLPSGSWSTVAYARELILDNCLPVVEEDAQERIRRGVSRKVPHAYLEGDLVHFQGRVRPLAHPRTTLLCAPFLVACSSFQEQARLFLKCSSPINYNPRFARCFYKDAPTREQVSKRFMSASRMLVLGWSFMARGARFCPLAESDRCPPQDLAKASSSERSVLKRGRDTTQAQADRLVLPRRLLR